MNQIEFAEWPTQAHTNNLRGDRLKIGVIKLSNPKALNSLTLPMVEAGCKRLLRWEADPLIAMVLIYSDLDKAFCAGGDVKTVVQNLNDGDADQYARKFFEWEYKMDYTLQTYSKPVLSWGNGIVMGGGMGVFCGSSHRVVTETSVLAMPEISIGFFPDVGAGIFLNQIPRPLALLLAWSAARLNPRDALKLGFATHYILASKRTDVFSKLRNQDWSQDSNANRQLLTKSLQTFGSEPTANSEIDLAGQEIKSVFAPDEAKTVASRFLEADFKSTWLKTAQQTFKAGSPMSALVAFEQIQRASTLSPLDVFVMEWNLARQMCARANFREGVRSKLIDKDNNPRWTETQIAAINDEDVQAHFAPYTRGGESQEQVREFFLNRKSWT